MFLHVIYYLKKIIVDLSAYNELTYKCFDSVKIKTQAELEKKNLAQT